MSDSLKLKIEPKLKAKISTEELEEQEEKLEEIRKKVSRFRHNRPTELKNAWLEQQKAKIAKYLVIFFSKERNPAFYWVFQEHDDREELSSDLQTDSTMDFPNPTFRKPEIEIANADNKLSDDDLAKIKKVRFKDIFESKTNKW